jgi:hypothetical protein
VTVFAIQVTACAVALAVVITLFAAALFLPDESLTSIRQDAAELGGLAVKLPLDLGLLAGGLLILAAVAFGSFWRSLPGRFRRDRTTRPPTRHKHRKPRRFARAPRKVAIAA